MTDLVVATGSSNGLMSSSDKTKLDAVPTPANIVVTSDPRLSDARTPVWGAGATRPSSPTLGEMFFDTSLVAPKPIWWDSTQWVDATGTPA